MYCPQSEHWDVFSGLSRFPVFFWLYRGKFFLSIWNNLMFSGRAMLLLLQGRVENDPFGLLIIESKYLWSITSTISLTIKYCCRKVPFLWSLFTCQQHKAQLCSELTVLLLLCCKTEEQEQFLEKLQLFPRHSLSQLITNTFLLQKVFLN